MSKRIYIFYKYMGVDIQFAFEETFEGRIWHEDGVLSCGVMKEDGATIVVIMTNSSQEELMRTIIDKW